ncbi:S-adenosylmethionine mitochondrial carrier protein homolog isoform X2 [Wyeomyia smithii]|uniref:S-adenosylmethionine mitochondrial carrier protein homolog isoform X2 n=1 Tax=Wyeomyia smithii TaxID=174621 RepID=UPI002467FC4A|nr:S-adenosylmethionine mitochondrial carrier protein homolog isoform X2 [Wyeomyia smithii]
MSLDNRSISSNSFVYWSSLISGGVAGLVVDIVLFPIDTIKTRLQSERGFVRSGGFQGRWVSQSQQPYVHMVSAAGAEVVACLIRVPIEIAKQRRQALSMKHGASSLEIWYHAVKSEGIRRGLYRGFGTTIMREVPFSFIQFPLWEYFKLNWSAVTGTSLTPLSVAVCGAIAGGIAAGLTTPLDVAKTRIMLADEHTANRSSVSTILRGILRERGIKGMFAGFVPRVLWITLGGAFFFGFYDLTSRLLNSDESI